ncbi:hypothetical protein [Sphingobacterium bovistauri]|uniref:CCDC81-like prokaryotic HU domain-containing protein n=1 Tax=Sphingobacterium bovistauri TaxID=2781959 RepID=A0ABS7Z748_9SPHI|nr:hypothetical protein [Sphingobacterium bovistauri]MCA5005975.1 hypothetical protein [Sphingobacterium bovistauri]
MKENNTYNEELGGNNLPDSLRVNPFLTPKNFFEEQGQQILSQTFIQIDNVSDSKYATALNIPEGYFETLSDSIFTKISEQNIRDKVSEEGFTIPNDYFTQSHLDIEANISEQNLRSSVSTINFQVPSDYFETFENQLFTKLSERKLIDNVGKENGFAIPENYFEESNNSIEANVLAYKWKSEISNEDFYVPVGYFNELTDGILAKTSDLTKQEGTIITLPKRINWKKYSAAAAIVLTVGIGSYFGFKYNNLTSNTLVATDVNLQNVSDEEIISYLAQVSDGADLIHLAEYASDTTEETTQLDSEIDSEEIEEYLNYML